MTRSSRLRSATVLLVATLLAGLNLSVVGPAAAAPGPLTITPLGWNVVGLDSNTPTGTGPSRYSVGARVCNTGSDPVPNFSATWAWTSANTNINILGATAKASSTLAAGACKPMWWTVDVTKTAAAHNTARKFQITASGTGVSSVSTPANREIYVEKLISQNRNNVTGSSGPTNVYVGSTYTWTFSYDTGTFNQMMAGSFLDPSIFEIESVSQTMTTGGAGTDFYRDACGWVNDTTSPSYRSCTTNVKVGGTITTTVTAKVTGAGTTKISPVILDFSGSSFHYNTDYATNAYALNVTATTPPAPTVVNDTATTPQNTSVAVNVLANDIANVGSLDAASVTVTSAPANGTTSVNPATGAITYTPNGGFTGANTFTYQVCNTLGACASGTVSVTVTQPNLPPVAVSDNATVTNTSGASVVVDVLANDSDPNGNLDPTTVTVTTAAGNGNTTINPTTGAVTYTPNGNFSGTDTFTYQVCDSPGLCTTATVTVTVRPSATNDSAATSVNTATAIGVLVNDRGNLVPNSVTVTSGPANGATSVNPTTGAVTFTPNANFSGTDSFTYQVQDSTGQTTTATVTITVTPMAVNDATATDAGSSVTVGVLANDAGSLAPNSVTVTSGPANGATSVNPTTGAVTYTPNSGYSGSDSFTYRVCDTNGSCATATVDVTVRFVASNDNATTSYQTPVTIPVLANDQGSSAATVSVLSGPASGNASVNASGTITYTPDPGFSGTDSFTYQVNDGTTVTSATVTILVAPPTNTPPTANPDSVTTHGPVTIDVLANDVDSDGPNPLTINVLTATQFGSFGTATVVDNRMVFTPNYVGVGSDEFTYEACDGLACTQTTLRVNVVNAAPTAADQNLSVDQGASLLIVSTATDGDGDPLAYATETAPTHGSAVINASTGAVTYVASATYVGTDTLLVRATDPFGASTTYLVTIDVLEVTDPPPLDEPDVTATVTYSTTPTNGAPMGITVTIRNQGTALAQAPTITLTIPAGFAPDTFPSEFPGGPWSCSRSGQVITCTTATDLDPGDVLSLTIPGVVSGAAGSTFNTQVSVALANTESVTANNAAEVLGVVAAAPTSPPTQPPAPSTPQPTPVIQPPPPSAVDGYVSGEGSDAAALAATGAEARTLLESGLASLLLGIALMVSARRRRPVCSQSNR